VNARAVDTDAVMRALAEPQRRRILELVRDGELPAGEIAEHFDVTPQAVSQHLRTLKEAGLLIERRDGTRRLYALRPEAIQDVRAYLDQLWPASLARLKQTVERDRGRGRRGGA
jgi:DNA-binding transcriptional ArsR family regulator